MNEVGNVFGGVFDACGGFIVLLCGGLILFFVGAAIYGAIKKN